VNFKHLFELVQSMTEKLQVKVITTNILAHRRSTGENILEALKWVGISYREIWSAWYIHLFFTKVEWKIYSTYKFWNTRRSKSHTNIIWTYFPSKKLLTIHVAKVAHSNMFSVGWIPLKHLSGVSHVQNFQNICVCFFMNTALSINRAHIARIQSGSKKNWQHVISLIAFVR